MSSKTSASGLGDLARGATYTVRGNPLPYVVPPAAAVTSLIASGVLSHLWGAYADATPWESAWRSALLAGCSCTVMWGTWKVGRARKVELRVASLMLSAVASGGLWVLTFRGWTFDSVMVYLLGAGTASVLLALTKLLRGDGTDARPSLFGQLSERVKELQDIGQAGRPRVVDGRVVTDVEMVHGGDFAQLAKPEVRTAIASAHDLPAGGVRVVANRGSVRKGRIELSPVDMLENPPGWPGLSAPGGSIAEPLRLAVYQTGKQVPLVLPGDAKAGRNAIGVMVLLGQSGSGKTEFQLFLAAEARSRRDTRVTYIDGRKGLQLPAAFRNAMHTMIHDAAEGEQFLDSLVDQVARRAAQIGGHGHEQWTAGCRQCPPFEVVIVDEASKFIESEDTLVELAESVRSVGIFVLLGLQRATGDRMPTSVRTTIGAVICMGTKTTAEAARVLSEDTITAGADPGRWQNKKPGALYAELPGVDEEDYSLPARTYRPDRDALVAELVEHLDAARADDAEQALPVPVGEGEVVDEPAEGDGDQGDLFDDDPECPPLPVDPDCPPDGDPRTPLTVPNRPRIDLLVESEDGHRYTPEQVRSLVRQAIEDAHRRGITEVKPSSFAPLVGLVGEAGLKPPTMTKILKELCEPGPGQMLRRAAGRGVYEIVLPALASASAT
ncbi:hypothetical protein ACN267_31485 [Micromonospora sp. WMMD734]|uniref:hypothetical protein n=1 Tax=Micromonospora sp. WMMD734 TaxID=3404129 RepID=UPI003B9230C7